MLPIEKWQRGAVGKFYRPLKTPVSVRIDNDVLAWLKSQGGVWSTRSFQAFWRTVMRLPL
jgi:uncharacterized protein (DUF4415 family)